MKIAILSESSADEAALRALVDGVLGTRTTPVEMPTLRTRGWPSVLGVLPSVIRALHYRTDADGLLIVVDSNHKPFDLIDPQSRLLQVQQVIQNTTQELRSLPSRAVLRVSCGIACPAIEAWLLSHRRANINEAEWKKGLDTQQFPYTKLQLKKHLYGVERPSLPLEKEKMIEAANELATQLGDLEAKFPIGFGSLATEIRSWRRVGLP